MGYDARKDTVSGFKTIDVRGIQGNFFQGLKKQAMTLPEGMEKQGKEHSEICETLKEKFGEKNPDVKV